MGTTFVHAKPERDAPGFWMRDGMLELWLRFLSLHIKEPTGSDSLEATIRDNWLLASRGYFNGCVPHRLDEAVSTEEGEGIVRDAIQSLLEALKKGPSHVSSGTLNLMGFSGFFHGDIETQRLINIGDAFLDLIDGKITEGAESTRFMPGS